MGVPRNKNLVPFRTTLGIADFGITGNKTLVSQTYSRVGTYTVGAQQEATFGATRLIGGGAEGEALYMRMIDTAVADVVGTVRLSIANAQETRRVVVAELRTERLKASETDRNNAVLLPEFGVNAVEDSKLIVDVRIDASSDKTFDYDATNSKFLVPVTIYQ